MTTHVPRAAGWILVAVFAAGGPARAQEASLVQPYQPEQCPDCDAWNRPQDPVRLFGNTFYVGTRGLAAVLITSSDGHVLLDGGLPNSAPAILANIERLGFAPTDVRVILNSHAHFDHAGGLAALQSRTRARVAASPPSAAVLSRGASGPDDPQFGLALAFPPVAVSDTLRDGETVRVGDVAVTVLYTGGHMPGGSSFTWQSCDDVRCMVFVYADSQTPVSAEDFRFSDNTRYPNAVADFQRGWAGLERLPCDVLVTPHPGASSLWQRLERGTAGLENPEACRQYVERARGQLAARLAREGTARPPDGR